MSEKLGMSPKKVYELLKEVSVLNDYIIPSYEPLHSQSKNYIVEDLVEVLKERGALK
ncbi:DUF3791 domain-containing protein [Clostridium sp. DL1XJH146]